MVPTSARDAATCEIKFLIQRAVAPGIREWARTYLTPDPHGSGRHADEYDATTLCFDTQQLDVFHRRASNGRAKYRVRRYRDPSAIFLERKLRKPGILIKRRTVGSAAALPLLEAPDVVRGWYGEWFHRRLLLRQLRPVCQISYHRVARTLDSPDGNARLTLDTGLRVGATDAVQFTQASGIPFLESHFILELKYRGHLPALCRRLVEEFALSAQPVSKYRLGMASLDQGAEERRVAVFNATDQAYA
jgi:VTC domain